VKRLKACAETLDNAETSSPLRPTSGEGRPSEINTLGGLNGLLEAVAIDQKSGMWLSPSVDSPGSVELLRGTNRGVAGVLYVLSRLQRTGVEIPGARNKAKAAVGWLVATPKTRAEMLPGLHFGECGVAVALAEAAVAGTTSLESVSPLIEQALEGPLDWPDMTHGAAGQGTAALIISDLLPKNGWDDYAHRCADYLTRSQSKDGSWQMPAGVSGLEGETFYGFAHGAAGIIYFLASYAARFEASDVDRAWKHASEWLQANAVDPEAAALEWRWSSHQETIWNYWCHGAPGIGLAFLRMYQISGDEHYAEVARRALDAPHESISHPSLSQCHGLAGIGEIYLEAARVLDDPEYRARAHRAAHTLSWLSSESERGGSSWLVEHPAVGTGDLMVGSGGIVHFLHRVQCRDPLSPPLLLEE
jgi:lantibiotic modifying enzyme